VAALAFNHYNALMSDKIREIRLGDRKAEYVEEADRWFRRAEEVHPRTVVDFYRHGMLYHHILTNQDKKALPLLNRAVANWEGLTPEQQERRHKDRRNYIKALYHLGKAHLNLGRYEEGEKLARKCIDADRETDYEEPIHKFYLLGKILLKAGHLEDALSHLRTAAGMRTQRPKDYVFCATAQCLAGLERHEEALQWLERTPPKFRKPHVKRLMGWIQYKLGRADEAGRLLEEALVGGPKGRHLTFLVMGEICRELGRWRDAANYFRKANEAKRKEFLNDFDDALYRLGMCLLRLGDRDGARDAFRRTLLVNDRHHEAARAMRELLAETGGVDGPPSDRGESNP
jgi:tetratricopeptide (TPR) repeat protein